VEITEEEEAQLHALSDSELAAVFAMVRAAEIESNSQQESDEATQKMKHEHADIFGSYTIVQKLRTRLRQLRPSKKPVNNINNS
jgi:hypothetical protein